MSLLEDNDFSRLEDAIVAILKAAVTGLTPAVHVLTAADLAGVAEQRQRVPALHVISQGFAPAPEVDPRLLRLTHTWYVVAAVSNVATQRSKFIGVSGFSSTSSASNRCFSSSVKSGRTSTTRRVCGERRRISAHRVGLCLTRS